MSCSTSISTDVHDGDDDDSCVDDDNNNVGSSVVSVVSLVSVSLSFLFVALFGVLNY